MTRCSASLVLWKMQVKTKDATTSCKGGQNRKDSCCQVLVRLWKFWNPHTLLVGMGRGTATLENGWAVPLKC